MIGVDKRKAVESSFLLAICLYVGDMSNTIGSIDGATNINPGDYGNTGSSDKSSQRWVFCNSLVRNMVKMRYKFGYDESHPCHRRGTVEQALDYGMQVLDLVILPLHSTFFVDHLSRTTNTAKKNQDEIHKSAGGLSGGGGKISSANITAHKSQHI